MNPKSCLTMLVACMALLPAIPAHACGFGYARRWGDVRYARAVVLARIEKYEPVFVVRPREKRKVAYDLTSDPEKKKELLKDWRVSAGYAKLTLRISDVIKGEAPSRLIVTWRNSTFALPATMPSAPQYIALRTPTDPTPPLSSTMGYVDRDPSSRLPIILQAPCSSPFIFDAASLEGQVFKRFMGMVNYPTLPWMSALTLVLCLWRRPRGPVFPTRTGEK